MACDICGKIGPTKEISDLLGLKGRAEAMCEKCEKVANTMLDRFRHMAWRRVRKKLLAMQKRNLATGGSPTGPGGE